MYKAAIFDLDGTIADTLTSIAYFANATLKKYGFGEIEKEKYKYFAGNGYKKLMERALKHAGGYDENTFDEISTYYFNLYDQNPLYLTNPFDGICEMLSDMKMRGMKTAVLSNKPHAATVNIISEIFGKDSFSYVQGGKPDIPLKPDPAALMHILSDFGAEKNECIYVGDTAVDMLTGKNAGVFTIGVLWGFRDEKELMENGADMIVSHPAEITKFIENSR